MQTEAAKTEAELTSFFAGLHAGLNSLREVRATYDEQIAFNFNMLRFFNLGETKVSEILAFFLDPKKEHGQKAAFLRLCLEHFNLTDDANTLLCADEEITIKCEDATKDNRRIDVTVSFRNAAFVIGIENKIYAKDQRNQVLDYCNDLEKRTHGNYKLLYLSPEGNLPSKESIDKSKLELLMATKKIQTVSYSDVVALLKKYETVCHADNVREFIRQFQQYIKQEYLGESFMGETNFVADYLHSHPEILKHADALRHAIWSTKSECFSTFWRAVAQNLIGEGITIDLNRMIFRDSGYSEALVKHHGSPFEASAELRKVSLFYEPKINPPVYITIGMSSERKNLPQQLRGRVEKFEEKLKEMNLGEVRGNVGSWWCAPIPIPHIKFNDGDELCNILKDIAGHEMLSRATEAAQKIIEYINVTESLWREIQPSP